MAATYPHHHQNHHHQQQQQHAVIESALRQGRETSAGRAGNALAPEEGLIVLSTASFPRSARVKRQPFRNQPAAFFPPR